MPSRWVSLGILVYWSIAAFCLLTWDVIPEFTVGYPPDMRAIALAGDSIKPVRWSVQVVDDPNSPDQRRPVGEAVTQSTRRPNGSFELSSRVTLDAGGLLRGTPFAARSSMKLVVASMYRVDPSGNLSSFDIDVKARESAEALLKIHGQLKGTTMWISSKGPVPILDLDDRPFPYEPRGVVQDLLGPLDRWPGLHVGQKWESRVINPFTGQVDSVRAHVTKRGLINWDGNPVSTFEVEQHMGPWKTKTWVGPDGVILRQEVPIPYVRLVLERRPDPDAAPMPPPKKVPAS
jgi:hypothetical protein